MSADTSSNGDFYNINLLDSIYGSYVKLDRLANLVFETYSNSSIESATKLNVFIDINSVIHALYSEHNRVQYTSITDLSSGIINLCAHYRGYFRTIGVDTRFFLINSNNAHPISIKILPDYNSTFRGKCAITKTNKLISNNMNLLKILCPYLPGIYYIESVEQYDAGVIIAHIIETMGTAIPNLIISKDLYTLQLTAMYPYTSYLRPVKKYRDDQSWMLPINEKDNFRKEFWDKVNIVRSYSVKGMYEISPINFPLFMALTKFPERSLPSITGPSQAAKIISSIVGGEDIKINSNQILTNSDIASKYPVAEIDARYKVLDIQYLLSYYRNSPEAKEIKFLDLEDSATVNKISSKYYANNPLNLLNL